MAQTPEGKVKAQIKKVLDSLGEDVHYDMPVPGGYGKPTVDYVGCFMGNYFAIEAKRAGKKPTPRQQAVLEKIAAAGGRTFVINDGFSLAEFKSWLDDVRDNHGRDYG